MTREEIKKAIDDVLDLGATDRYSISVGVITKKNPGSIETRVYRVQSGYIMASLQYRTFSNYNFFTEWLGYWKGIFETERSAENDLD